LRSMVDAHAQEAPRVDGTNGLITVFRGAEERDVYSCTPMCKRGNGS
jgi:hypothetical protein